MTQFKMTPDRVHELIAAYGADPQAWPSEARVEGEQWLTRAPDQFATALAAAQLLDQDLARLAVPEPSNDLAAAILAQAPMPRPAAQGLGGRIAAVIFPQGVRWPAGAALASLLMGAFGGYAYAATGIGYDQADAAYSVAFGWGTENEWVVAE